MLQIALPINSVKLIERFGYRTAVLISIVVTVKVRLLAFKPKSI